MKSNLVLWLGIIVGLIFLADIAHAESIGNLTYTNSSMPDNYRFARNTTWFYTTYSGFQLYNLTGRLYDSNNLLYRQTNYSNVLSKCYQESANVSNSCGGLSTGSYSITVSSVNCRNLSKSYDGNWDTEMDDGLSGSCLWDFYVNYTKPNLVTSAVWQAKSLSHGLNNNTQNITIPNTCFNTDDKLILWIDGNSTLNGDVSGNCWNNTGWQRIGTFGVPLLNKTLYEESIIWSFESNFTFSDLPYGTYHFNATASNSTNSTSTNTRTVYSGYGFSFCNATNNNTYLNITFRDEITNDPLNVSLDLSNWVYTITDTNMNGTYTYSNSTALSSNSYCFYPEYEEITLSSILTRYSASGYATKTLQYRDYAFSNITNNTVVYLISLVDSGATPVTFQLSDAATSAVLEDARVKISREISGTTALINDGYTDAAGSISYYMSPIYAYSVEVSKEGCTTATYTITPTGSTYPIAMDCSDSAATSTAPIDGLRYFRSPSVGIINPGYYNFTFYTNSSLHNMTQVRFDLYDDDGILATNSSYTNTSYCSPQSCNLVVQYNLVEGETVLGRYYVATNASNGTYILIEADAKWITIYIDSNQSGGSISRFFANFNDLIDGWGSVECIGYTTSVDCSAHSATCKWVDKSDGEQFCLARDEYNKREFDRFVIIFFLLAVGMFLMAKITSYEFIHPGAFIIVLCIAIFIGSYYDMFYLNGLTAYTWINKWIVAGSTFVFTLGVMAHILRRTQY